MTPALRSAPTPRRRFLIAARIVGLVVVGGLAQACGSTPVVDAAAPAESAVTAAATTEAVPSEPVTTSPAPTTTAAPTTTTTTTVAEVPVAPAYVAPRVVPTTVRKPQALVAAPKPAPKPARKPVAAAPKPAPEPAAVSYASCAAVKAAGKAPIHTNDPGYSRKLDRDGDGIACET